MNPKALLRVLYHDIRGEETGPSSDEEHLSATIDWLYRSQDVTDGDGSSAYYSLLSGWAGAYPETSGYLVPTLYDYASFAEAIEARNRAERMAKWLLTTQLSSGAFPGGIQDGTPPEPSVFNTGQIMFGLLRGFQETGDEQFLDAIELAGDWLVDIQHPEGYWNRFDYRDAIHSYSSRVAWALLMAADELGNDSFRNGAISNLQWVTSVQSENGWFEYAGFSPKELPYLHTIAYTVRGLFEGGLLLDDDDFVSAGRTTADRLLECQERHGPLVGAYDRSWNGSNFYCLTGNAQMALIWLRLFEQFGEHRYLDAANDEISFLKRQHTLFGTSPIQGGVRGSHPIWSPYMRFRYPNWAAKFFCDALIRKSQLS